MSLAAWVFDTILDIIAEEEGIQLTAKQRAYLRRVLSPYLRDLRRLEAKIYWEAGLRKRPPPLRFWRKKRRHRILWWLMMLGELG